MSGMSTQHKLDMVRRPRVQITYDVETNGAMTKIELPFAIHSLLQVGDAILSGPQAELAPHSAVVGARA